MCAFFPLTSLLSQGRLIACSAGCFLRRFYFQIQQQLMCVAVIVHQYVRWLQLNVAQSSSLFHVKV